jgi:ribosomal protein L21E
MTFQFSETARISEQIAQLQKQLEQLTASLQPYRECEQKAEELRLQVEEYGHEMTAKGIPQDDILNWAKSLYSAASGSELNLDSQLELQEELRKISLSSVEIAAKLKLCEEERDQALARITKMTAAQLRVAENLKSLRDENTKLKNFAAQTDTAAIEILQKENASLITRIKELEAPFKQTNFKVGDIVQYKNGEIGKVFHIIPDSHNYGTVQVQLENKMVEIPIRDLVLCASDALNENVQDEDRQAYTKILTKDDIVQTDTGEVGTVTGFAYGNVIVKLVNGEFNFRREQLKWISTKEQAPQLHNFQEGDRVEVKDIPEDDSLGYLLYKQGTVVGVKGNSVAVLIDATDDEGQHEVVLYATQIKAARHPDIEAQTRGREFINSIRSKAGMNNVNWQKISEVSQGNSLVLREMCLSATTKIQKELIEKLPQLMADYIAETGDITDMRWIPSTIKTKVEALLEAKKSLPYHFNDWVRVVETGEVWQIRSFDGEWLSVKQDNKIASLHKSEVELVQQEVA